ncbi:hypothetical protein Ndes2526B_g01523 [Nannochloris sp. 'desiccata']|nr:hypothetical protein KSW81_004158 [Chlorella desiccata (nom. nud.)]KAH7624260.1 putative General transcription factor IIE subunit 2 [Chlorella desiccata (nom. nud.)]
MAPPKGGNVLSVLAKFRTDQVKAAKVQAEASKEREEKLKKVQSGGVKKPTAPRPSRSRAKTTTSSGPAGSDVPSGSGAGGAAAAGPNDWKTAVAKPLLPLGMRQKQVVDFLRQRESPATATEIAVATGREIKNEPDLASALDANPKVQVDVDAGTFAYLPEANVRSKKELLDYICRAGAPVATSELADAYRTVLDDVAALKDEGIVMGLHSFDPEVNCEVLYAVDTKLIGIECDPEVAALWLSTEVPDDDEEITTELQKVNLPHVPRKAPRKKAPKEKKRKQRKASKLRAVTNAHLMHLLEGDAPNAIDNI